MKRYGMILADNGSTWYVIGRARPALVERPAACARCPARLRLRGRRHLEAASVTASRRRTSLRRRAALDADVAAHRRRELLDDREPEAAADRTVARRTCRRGRSGRRRAPGRPRRCPGPVSATRAATPRPHRRRSRPRGVSRSAFSIRFDATCSSRSWSARPTARPLRARARRRSPAPPPRAARPPRGRRRQVDGSRRTENSLRFIRARSSRSWTSRSSRWTRRLIVRGGVGGSNAPSASPSAQPRIAVSGVFSSWLTESRKARSASREARAAPPSR